MMLLNQHILRNKIKEGCIINVFITQNTLLHSVSSAFQGGTNSAADCAVTWAKVTENNQLNRNCQ